MKKFIRGLSLGSGGAKGLVHVGALQAFQEENISFDIVCGTSIGSLIGGMYSLNYTAREILNLIKEFGFTKTTTLLEMKLKKITLYKILVNVLGERDFKDLKKPYFAVATNLYTGEEKVFNSGDLCLAIACSCSIPPLFAPVKVGNSYYVDGAYVNSVPADVLKSNGANKVFSIDLSADLPTNYQQIKVLDILYPKHKIKKCARSEKGYKYSNYIFYPNLSKYSATKLNDGSVLFEVGYEFVKKNIEEIKNKLEI